MSAVGTAWSRHNAMLDYTAYWLHRLSHEIIKEFEASLVEAGVTVLQWQILLAVHRGTAAATLAIAKLLDVDAGFVTRSLDKLERKGLLVRTKSRDDRRSITLSLSDRGRALLEGELLAAANSFDQDWLEDLTEEELSTFKRLLGKLLARQGVHIPPYLITGDDRTANSTG